MEKSFWPAVFTILVGTFMAVLDTSIVNVAIPKMMAVFGVSADEIQWVLTGYTLVMAAVIPLTGYLGNRFGYKKIYILSFVLFTVGSLLCGIAWNNSTMVAARVIQAVGGGLLMPVGQAMIYHVVPPEKMGPAMGVFGISVMVAPAIGPTLSGYIVEYLDWHFIFTINVPIGLIGILMAWTFLKETEINKREKFDFLGLIYSTIMLTTFLLAVTKGEEKGWTSFYIVSLFSVSLISILLLIYHEMNTENPLLDLRLFKISNYTYGVLISCFLMVGMFGVVYLVPIYAENLLGYSAMKTGVLMFPQSLSSGIITLLTGALLMSRFGGKPLIILGLILTAINGYMLSFLDLNTSSSYLQILLAVRGLGLGFCMMTSMQLPLQGLTKVELGGATALLNVTRQIATSIGVAILTSVFQTQGQKHVRYLADTVNAHNPINGDFLSHQQQMYMAQGYSSTQSYGMALNSLVGLVKKYATIYALEDALWVSTFFILLAIPFALLLKERKMDKTQDQQHTVVEM